MNVRQLRKILQELPPELDEAAILSGMWAEEITRLVYLPNSSSGKIPGFHMWEHAIWIDSGGERLGPGAAEEGRRVLALELEPAKFIPRR